MFIDALVVGRVVVMKKVVIFLFIIVGLISLTACGKKSDAVKFKEEYESLNNQDNGNHKIREISIDKDNPIIYSTAEKIVDMITNKETFVVYFGFPKCPWCRSMLETFLEVAKDRKITKIYYVDVYDIRDTKELVDGEVKTTKEGSKGYNELLEKLDSVLSDYELSTEDGEKVSTGEKRIFAPNVVAVVNGEAIKLTEGISDKQEDAYQDLTEELKKDMYEQLECVFKCLNEKNTCTKVGC